MSVEIAWKQNIMVTDFHLLKSLLVVLGFCSQTNICGFSRQNICSVLNMFTLMRFQVNLNDYQSCFDLKILEFKKFWKLSKNSSNKLLKKYIKKELMIIFASSRPRASSRLLKMFTLVRFQVYLIQSSLN